MMQDLVAANRIVALGFLDAIVAGDSVGIERLLHRDCTWWVQGWGTVPRDGFVRSLNATMARAATRTMKILSVTAEADRVAVAAEGAFVFPEGVYANTYHYLFTIDAGQIRDGREYLDTRVAAAFFTSAA